MAFEEKDVFRLLLGQMVALNILALLSLPNARFFGPDQLLLLLKKLLLHGGDFVAVLFLHLHDGPICGVIQRTDKSRFLTN